ncbi:unnamed protein product [Protopolystoma xenopodis]|uniref:SH3 domain-containing protein n=1 Tax=Protopolystoma xenopodis TaxID=117903 RepID=A0A3S5ANM4_9PLAT|nr:unnamed protein product [Protopolystoma xenopodis]
MGNCVGKQAKNDGHLSPPFHNGDFSNCIDMPLPPSPVMEAAIVANSSLRRNTMETSRKTSLSMQQVQCPLVNAGRIINRGSPQIHYPGFNNQIHDNNSASSGSTPSKRLSFVGQQSMIQPTTSLPPSQHNHFLTGAHIALGNNKSNSLPRQQQPYNGFSPQQQHMPYGPFHQQQIRTSIIQNDDNSLGLHHPVPRKHIVQHRQVVAQPPSSQPSQNVSGCAAFQRMSNGNPPQEVHLNNCSSTGTHFITDNIRIHNSSTDSQQSRSGDSVQPKRLLAIFEYQARTDEELSLRKGDEMVVLNDR